MGDKVRAYPKSAHENRSLDIVFHPYIYESETHGSNSLLSTTVSPPAPEKSILACWKYWGDLLSFGIIDCGCNYNDMLTSKNVRRSLSTLK